MFQLKSKFKPAGDQPEAIEKLSSGLLKKGYDFQTLLGVTGSGKTFTMANLIKDLKNPVLVIAPNKSLAAQLYREYKNFFPNNTVCYFVSYYDYYQPEAYIPITDTYIGKETVINEEIDKLRHLATSALMTKQDVIVVASVSCIYNLGVPISYFGAAIHLEISQTITRNDLIRQLIRIHFQRTNSDLKRGFFRIRGDIIEIIPASGEFVYRIELKDQKVDSLAILDQLTRKITQNLKELVILPPKHFITTEPAREKAIKEIEKELKERINFLEKKNLWLEAERLNRRAKNDMVMLKTLGYCNGIENYSRHLTGKLVGDAPDTLLGYFPWKDGKPDFLTIIDESHITIPQIRGMYKGDKARKQVLVDYGFRLPSALDNRPLRFDEFLKRVGKIIFTSATPADFEFKNSKQVVNQIIRPTFLIDPEIEIRPVFDKEKNISQIDDIIKEINKYAAKKERVLVNTLTKKTAEELSDFLINKGIKANYMHSETKTIERTEILTAFRRGKFDVLVGINLLREGLDLPEVSLVAVLDADREGFLRSETSFIQLMGRAARNVNGRVILYADRTTGSMRRAIKESKKRRKIQLEYNKQYNVKPMTIEKEIKEFLEIEGE